MKKMIAMLMAAAVMAAGYVVFAQAADEPVASTNAPAPPVAGQAGIASGVENVLEGMLAQILNSPASALIILLICIVSTLVEVLPFISSKYVMHICVLAGIIGYAWIVPNETVPKSFSNPLTVLCCNGAIVGFIGFLVHKSIIAKWITKLTGGGAASPTILIAIGLSSFLLVLAGCKTAQTDPVTGQQVEVYDPVKTQQVKDALEPMVRIPVRRLLMNNKKDAEKIALYLRGVGGVFCRMKDAKQFDPTTLTAGLQELLPPNLAEDENVQMLLDFKVALEGLYKTFWNDRFRAELSAEEWPYHVADYFCLAVDNGLKDAGLPGVR